MEYRDKDFEGETVLLDGNTFTGCTFRRCVIRFGASAPIDLAANHFREDCQWQFGGAAGQTLKVLAGLYGSGEGGRQIAEDAIQQIRNGIDPVP